MNYCYTIQSGRDRGVHIPGCMGCAVFGHYACTCPGKAGIGSLVCDSESNDKELVMRVEELEERVAMLEKSLTKEAHS